MCKKGYKPPLPPLQYSQVSKSRAQRTVIDVIVRGNWLPSSHKTAACCLASFMPKLALDVPHLRLSWPSIKEATVFMKRKLEINKLKAFGL